jgi:hypothetical protein
MMRAAEPARPVRHTGHSSRNDSMSRIALKLLSLSVALSCTAAVQAKGFEQVWTCSLNPGQTLDQARSVSAEWLRAARGMHSGEGLSLSLCWPIAVPDSAERFEFVVRASSLEAWGALYDLAAAVN